MNKNIWVILSCAILLFSCDSEKQDSAVFEEMSIAMGVGSANDVYLSLSNGTLKTVTRADWDIAFSVPLQTATIITNEGAGVELYCVSDTSQWSIIDEGDIEGLEPRFNNKSDWSTGSFNQNAGGFPNYGWGTYHAGNPDHNVGGDSLYVLRLTNGAWIKFMVRVKLGTNSGSVIRWANLDGSEEHMDTISTAPYYLTHNFLHYSLVNQSKIEFEPMKNAWDMLFTRYIVQIPAGPGVIMNYPVTGILVNKGVTVARVEGVTAEQAVEEDASAGYVEITDQIGYDWKVSDPVTHEMTIVDNLSYFVKSVDGRKYHLYFTAYDGLAQGNITLKVRRVE